MSGKSDPTTSTHSLDGETLMPTRTDSAQEIGMHVFERAGLGKAPFQFIGMERKVGPIKLANGMECGAPGQAMGSCEFCGTGIADCCQIRSADGKTFIVGTTCVNKTGDIGLIKAYKRSPEYRDHQRKTRHDRETKKIEELKSKMEDPATRERLSSMPHPSEYHKEKTALDYAEWMMDHSGNSGKIRLLKWINESSEGGAS